MLNNLNDIARRHLAQNLWVYTIILFMFIVGVSLGALTVNTLDDATREDAKTYIEGFLNIAANNEISQSSILRQSIKFNLYFSVLVLFSGLFYLGVVLVPVLAAFRGYCIGFTVAFLTQSMGSNGFYLALASVLPQNLIYVPVIIILCACALNQAFSIFRNKYFRKYSGIPGQISAYIISIAILFVLFVAGSIVESYITSTVIKLITPYLI